MTLRLSSPAPAAPDAEKPRIVCRYSGMQIWDCRDRIKVVLAPDPPPGIRGGLKIEGFQREPDGSWSIPATPMAIMTAQVIGKTYFEEDGIA